LRSSRWLCCSTTAARPRRCSRSTLARRPCSRSSRCSRRARPVRPTWSPRWVRSRRPRRWRVPAPCPPRPALACSSPPPRCPRPARTRLRGPSPPRNAVRGRYARMQGRVEAGVLHPGAMGASLGATRRQNCEAVLWAAQGRSPETHHRAQQAGLTEVPDLSALASRAQVIVSICPPHAAEEVARDVARHAGPELELYIDANAVAPATVERIAELFDQDRVVDAALVGPPAWQPGTFLWLSGPRAEEAAELFADTPLDVRVLG